MKTTKNLPSQITISCGRDEDAGRLVLAAAEGEPAKLRRFSITAYTGGKMSLPNIPYPVVVDMSGLRVSAKSRPILRDHNPSQIVGHTDNVTVNGGVLKVDGSVSGANAHATEIVASSDNGFPWQASIGASVQKMVFVEDGERVQVNGRSFAGPLYVARQATLGEVSFVALGADDQTSAPRGGADPRNLRRQRAAAFPFCEEPTFCEQAIKTLYLNSRRDLLPRPRPIR